MDDKRFQDDDSIIPDDWLADMEKLLDELDRIFEEEEACLKAEFPDYPGVESSSRR